MQKTASASVLPLSAAVFLIRQVLSVQERRCYAIIKQIKQSLGYRWIEVSGEHIDPTPYSAQRRYYRLTVAGLKIMNAAALRRNRTDNCEGPWFTDLKPQVV